MTVEQFDEWYGAMAVESDARDELVHRHLGLPVEVRSTSLLSLDGLLEVRNWLRLAAEDVLVDLACGRGGYGMWLARDVGARVVGVDFSAVAIEQARRRTSAFSLGPDRAEFRVGELEASTLPDASVDAVLCVDAIQFSSDPVRVGGEMRRMLRAGGRVAVTSWEAIDRADERVPERMRRLDLAAQLAAAGLVDVTVHDKPEWLRVEKGLWEEALAIEPGADASLGDLREEAERVLPAIDGFRRVLATAVRASS